MMPIDTATEALQERIIEERVPGTNRDFPPLKPLDH
jgi:hypothetical protein